MVKLLEYGWSWLYCATRELDVGLFAIDILYVCVTRNDVTESAVVGELMVKIGTVVATLIIVTTPTGHPGPALTTTAPTTGTVPAILYTMFVELFVHAQVIPLDTVETLEINLSKELMAKMALLCCISILDIRF